MSRVFTNGLGDWGSIPCRVIPKTQKMILDAALLNSQHLYDRALSMGQIELECVLMLNLIARNRTVFDIETVFILNWIVSNRTVLTFNSMWTKTILILNWIVWIRTV